MKTILTVLTVAALATAAQADIFSDNFDTENSGNEALNYSGLANWTVSNGTIDLIGNGGTYDFLPGNGLYIDLDGSTSNAGELMSLSIFLTPGSYTLSYDLAGSHRGSDETVDVTFGGAPTANHFIPSAQGFTTYSINLNVVVAGNVTITFQNLSNDNIGALLDNVSVVPTPGSAALMGLGGLALARRRRQA